jgi:hypothetical protein
MEWVCPGSSSVWDEMLSDRAVIQVDLEGAGGAERVAEVEGRGKAVN